MKFDPDCVRDILLDIEELHDYPQILFFDSETKLLRASAHSFDKLAYHMILLDEAGYLNWTPVFTGGRHLYHSSIHGLTYDGHQFLETVRNPRVWEETKSLSKKVGSFSLNVISSVATDIIARLIKAQL